MRFVPNIRYGTERYPEKVARRLRAVNITAWLAAAAMALVTLKRPADPDVVTLLTAIGVAAIPLLHRFGPLVAPLALLVVASAHAVRVVQSVGTGDGILLLFLTAAPLSILLLGIERVWLAGALSAAAAGLVIVLHALFPHDTGALSPPVLFVNFAMNFSMNLAVLFAVVYYVVRQAARAEARAESEHERSELLLGNILPPRVAERLKDRADAEVADAYPAASILFADIVGFTALSKDISPEVLVRFLNGVFTLFDGFADRHGLEKIKTIGDAYMVVSGVPERRRDHAAPLADFALDIRKALTGMVDPFGRVVQIRIGMASGPVVAGVVGTRKFSYDVWGDAVNTASRMESTGEAGKIQVAAKTHKLLANRFQFSERGHIEVRGKGRMQTWFLVGRKQKAKLKKRSPKLADAAVFGGLLSGGRK